MNLKDFMVKNQQLHCRGFTTLRLVKPIREKRECAVSEVYLGPNEAAIMVLFCENG